MHSPRRRRTVLCSAIACALGISHEACAVRIEPDGLGQALIFPYYTVQSAGGNPFNTYLSIVNTTSDAKAVRVRFREGRMGAEALSFNLFLSPNDVWTSALVPFGNGTRVVTLDHSCTDGLSAGATSTDPSFADFHNTAFSGANDDGAGSGLDRTREGFVEMIEMATLTGASAAAVTHVGGFPANCAAVQGSVAVSVSAPTGGLSGGLTLINVANGMEFPMNAVALAELSKRPFYRQASDPYPDFNAAEIDPASSIVANGALYRSTWSRPVDAVSALFMHSAFITEYVLDDATLSNTDVVATFPTRESYVSTTSASAPFSAPVTWTPHCQASAVPGDLLFAYTFDRDEAGGIAPGNCQFDECTPPPATLLCAATVVMDVTNGSSHTVVTSQTRVLGSLIHGYTGDGITTLGPFAHGWFRGVVENYGPEIGLTSLSSSTRTDLATGSITSGPQTYYGLPVIGFAARTFVNGTLTCSAGACQGNYGGAFPFEYIRRISP